ncbi:hypothetical protein IIC65_08805, partial [Candidatus Sumerlaeota bacterium]|nr:hypothetical protein [Candidatus Sumerlaeota bacterium]
MMGNDNARGNAGRLAIGLIALGAWIGSSTAGAQEGWQRSPTRLESRNQRFEQAARENTPPEEAVLFVGSATIAGWDLDRWFPEYETIKRGIGGTMISESTYFAERVIIPHKPSTIVLYSGDNDVWLGKTPAMVADDFEEFVDKVRTPLPNVQIIFISIRPSIARWDVVEKFREANALIEKIIERDEHLYYADIATAMIGGDGKPRKELLTADDLHFTEAGFALWTSI